MGKVLHTADDVRDVAILREADVVWGGQIIRARADLAAAWKIDGIGESPEFAAALTSLVRLQQLQEDWFTFEHEARVRMGTAVRPPFPPTRLQ